MKFFKGAIIALIIAAAIPATAQELNLTVSSKDWNDTFSNAIKLENYFDVCLSGEFSGRVTLQRSTDGGFNWKTFRTFDGFFCGQVESRGWAVYRIGVKGGDLESGQVEITLTKKGI